MTRLRMSRGQAFVPFDASAVITQGNIILATWRSDPGIVRGGNGVWYSYKTLDAPGIMPGVSATQTVNSNSNPQDQSPSPEVGTPTPAGKPVLSEQEKLAGGNATDPTIPLWLGIVPVVLVLLFVLFVSKFTNTNWHL